MKLRKNRYLIALEGIVANLLLGALFTWTIFRNPMLEIFPTWSEGMLSIIFGIHNVFVCIGVLLGGKLSRRFSRRKLFLFFAFIELIGLGGFTILPISHPMISFVMAIGLFTIFAALGIGLGINIVQSATLSWFPDHTGMVSGALYMALGLSSMILASLANKLLPLFGVKISIGIMGILIFIISMIILCDPYALSVPTKTQLLKEHNYQNDDGLSTKQMLRTLSYWLLFIWNVCIRGAGLIMLDHAANIALAYSAATLVGLLISPANGLGSFSFGTLLDRIGLRHSMIVISLFMFLSASLLLIGGHRNDSIVVIMGLVFGGLSYGGSSSTYAAAIKLMYGQKNFSLNLGIANCAMGVAAILGSFSGYLLDATNKNYISIFYMIGIMTILPIICSLLFRDSKNKYFCQHIKGDHLIKHHNRIGGSFYEREDNL